MPDIPGVVKGVFWLNCTLIFLIFCLGIDRWVG